MRQETKAPKENKESKVSRASKENKAKGINILKKHSRFKWWTPCSEKQYARGLQRAAQKGKQSKKGYVKVRNLDEFATMAAQNDFKIKLRRINLQDFTKVLLNFRPSTQKENLQQFIEWTEKYGQKGTGTDGLDNKEQIKND